MSRFLRFAYPVLVVLLVQIFIVSALPMKPGYSRAVQVCLFALVDSVLGAVQWVSFRRDRAIRRELERLRGGRP